MTQSVQFRTELLPLPGALKPLERELGKPYWAQPNLFVP